MWQEGLTGEGTKEKCTENVIHPVFQLMVLHPCWMYGQVRGHIPQRVLTCNFISI
jgi:hypothetical protein